MISLVYTVLLLTPTTVAGVQRLRRLSVCLFVRTIKPKLQSRAVGIVHHKSSPSCVYGIITQKVIIQKVKGQGHGVIKCKNIDDEGDRVAGVSLHLYRVPITSSQLLHRTATGSATDKQRTAL